MPLLEVPQHHRRKEPFESLQEIPLSPASTSQRGGWRNWSSGEGPAPPSAPSSPVPELSWHCILPPALHLPLRCLLFFTSISPFSGSHQCPTLLLTAPGFLALSAD